MHGRWVALAAVAMLAAGCGGGTEGTAVAGAPAAAFDPCSIPDTAIAATGLDPSSKQIGWNFGITMPDWKRCAWSGPQGDNWYFFVILFSEKYDLTDVKNNPLHYDFSNASIGDRNGLTFRYKVTKAGECDTAFESIAGVATFAVVTMGGLPTKADPCRLVSAHATDLETHFPPNL